MRRPPRRPRRRGGCHAVACPCALCCSPLPCSRLVRCCLQAAFPAPWRPPCVRAALLAGRLGAGAVHSPFAASAACWRPWSGLGRACSWHPAVLAAPLPAALPGSFADALLALGQPAPALCSQPVSRVGAAERHAASLCGRAEQHCSWWERWRVVRRPRWWSRCEDGLAAPASGPTRCSGSPRPARPPRASRRRPAAGGPGWTWWLETATRHSLPASSLGVLLAAPVAPAAAPASAGSVCVRGRQGGGGLRTVPSPGVTASWLCQVPGQVRGPRDPQPQPQLQRSHIRPRDLLRQVLGQRPAGARSSVSGAVQHGRATPAGGASQCPRRADSAGRLPRACTAPPPSRARRASLGRDVPLGGWSRWPR